MMAWPFSLSASVLYLLNYAYFILLKCHVENDHYTPEISRNELKVTLKIECLKLILKNEYEMQIDGNISTLPQG